MDSPRFTIRLTREQLAAIKKLAGTQTPSEWLRGLIAQATGIDAELPRGLAAVSPKRRKRYSRIAVAARQAQRDT